MKHANKLLLLFFTSALLLGLCLLLIHLQKDTNPKKADDIFYCGNAAYLSESNQNSIHEAGEQLFKENCKSCHKIHEVAVGPALFGVTTRRPTKWIYAFIHNSDSLINSGDTMAVNVYNKYNKCIMTSFPTFTNSEIDSMLIYIEASTYISDQPLTKIVICK